MNSQRILILGGLILILLGYIFGFTNKFLITNSLRQARLESIQLTLDYAHKAQLNKAHSYLKQAEQIQEFWELDMEANSHIIMFGFQSLLFAFFLPNINLNQNLILILSLFLVLGGFLLPSGIVLEVLGLKMLGLFTTLLGGSWLILATIGFAAGFLLHWKKPSVIRRSPSAE